MSLELHVTQTAEAVEKRYPDLEFDEEIHNLIFAKKRDWLRQAPLFSRMRDYYADTSFSLADLPALCSESELILRQEANPRVLEFVRSLRSRCEVAIQRKLHLYCFCD